MQAEMKGVDYQKKWKEAQQKYRRGAFVTRWGAYGDMFYCLPALELLKRDYGYLHFETGPQGAIVFGGNDTFDRISIIDPKLMATLDAEKRALVYHTRKEGMESTGWDKFLDFWRCLEVSCIAEMHQRDFFMEREFRQQKYGTKNFYDEHLVRAGYKPGENCEDNVGTFQFHPREVDWIEQFRNKVYKDRFVVTFALCGSTGQKVPQRWEELAGMIQDKHPDTLFCFIGDRESEQLIPRNVKSYVSGVKAWDYRRAVCAVRCSDYVVGPETSMLVAAGCFGIPKTMIATACNVYQACHYHKNDFSIQSTAQCSPCHKAIYNYSTKDNSQFYCNQMDSWLGPIPSCNFLYELEPILKGVDFAYQMRSVRDSADEVLRERVASLPDLSTLSVSRAGGDGKV